MQNMGTKRVGRRGGNATFMTIAPPRGLDHGHRNSPGLATWVAQNPTTSRDLRHVIKVIKGDADTGNHVAPIVGVGVSSIVVGGLLLMFVRRRRTALE